jgi:quercetin dioxygenase-like cupin family protein
MPYPRTLIGKENPMQATLRAFSLAILTAAVGAAGFEATLAAEQEYKSKAKATSLVKTALPGVEGKEIIIKRFEAPPGFVGGKHYHPGPVFVYVLEGEFTIETEEVERQTFKAGELYQEPIRRPMRARNLSKSDNLKLLVFQVGDAGKPMMVKVK